MSKFVTLVLEPRFNDEYGEYANLPVFNAHGDIVGYTGGEVPETGNPCKFYVMDEEGFPVCHSASENVQLRELVRVFYHCTTSGVCDECPVNGGGAVHLMPDTICDTMHDRMRELGFEVEQ